MLAERLSPRPFGSHGSYGSPPGPASSIDGFLAGGNTKERHGRKASDMSDGSTGVRNVQRFGVPEFEKLEMEENERSKTRDEQHK